MDTRPFLRERLGYEANSAHIPGALKLRAMDALFQVFKKTGTASAPQSDLSLLPLPRFGHCAASVGGKLSMWGGRTRDFSVDYDILRSNVHSYDTLLEAWGSARAMGELPPGVYLGANAATGDELTAALMERRSTPLYRYLLRIPTPGLVFPATQWTGPWPRLLVGWFPVGRASDVCLLGMATPHDQYSLAQPSSRTPASNSLMAVVGPMRSISMTLMEVRQTCQPKMIDPWT